MVLLWMDNNYVLLLTTIHQVKGRENYVWSVRRRPGPTSTNAKVVRPIFGDSHTRRLLIPVVINMYNYFMGGVDIADQRRSYWPTQLRVSRNWLPIFFFFLDTIIVNAFLLYRTTNLHEGALLKDLLDHRQFREKLYQEHLSEGSTLESNGPMRRPHTVKDLPATRHQTGNHQMIKLPKKITRKGYCAYCLWVRKEERAGEEVNAGKPTRKRVFGTALSENLAERVPKGAGKRATQTRTFCLFCKTFICESCFDLYHKKP